MTVLNDTYKGWYNGFSMEERRAVNPLMRAARMNGTLNAPRQCSVCDVVQSKIAPIRMEWHLEDYRNYLQPYSLCHRCHWALHARFERPQRWTRLIARYSCDCWFQKLTMDPLSKGRSFDLTYPTGLPANSRER